MTAESAGAPSPRSLIVEWATRQDAWVRAIAADILDARSEIPEDRLGDFYELFLREKELRPGGSVPGPALTTVSASEDGGEPLILTALEQVQHVNRLATGQAITFNPRMTVLFGENASGKTGYVRILKKAAAVRAAEAILPDIGSMDRGKPEARIRYKLGTVEGAVDWRGEEGVYPLNRMDVFDSRSTAVYVDEDLTYRYTPGELALFPMIQHALEATRRKLEEEIGVRKPRGNPFVQRFSRETALYAEIEALGPATDIQKLEQLGAVSPEEKQRAQALEQELVALRSGTPQAQQRVAEAEARSARSLINLLTGAGSFDLAGYDRLTQESAALRAQLADANSRPLRRLAVPEALRPAWERFVMAGEEYLLALGRGDSYPVGGDACLYCRQPLAAEAVELLTQYRAYCDNELRRAVAEADRRLASLIAGFERIDIGGGVSALDERLSSDPDGTPEAALSRELRAALSRLADMQRAVKARQRYEWPGLAADATGLVERLKRRAANAEALSSDLTKRVEDRATAIKERQGELEALKARIALQGALPEIQRHVTEAKWASKAEQHVKRFASLLRSLTDASKAASEELLNRDFERRFQQECEALRAPKVALQFPGRQGQVSRKKSVAADHRPSEVLSEGEQKVIALADVLAEVGLKQAASPIVFDDPVNSLDYKRLEYVVGRLEALSRERQIIVFTHNIWFATEILARFEKAPADCAYFDIQGDGPKCGVVTRGTHPRSDTYKSLRSSINSLIDAAKKAAGEPQAALLEKAYEHLRNACEVVVETELLQGVTRRYQPNVMMTKLPEIKCEKLPGAIKVVMEVFDRACRFIGSHSQPMETLNIRPTLEGLQGDWRAIQKVHDDFSGGG